MATVWGMLGSVWRWLALVGLAAVAACAGDDGEPAAVRPDDGAVVVASFDFAESELLGEIYAQALEDEGVAVRRELRLGSRELVVPAMQQGFVDVVPEYAGSALDAAAPRSPADRSDLDEVAAALADAVEGWGFAVLAPAAAANQNALAMRGDVARSQALAVTSDLIPLSGSLVAGGPPECPERPRCLPGLEATYGLAFERFVPLAGQDLVRRALEDGVIDVGVLFSTDAALAGRDLVVLSDDRDLQPADNVVPVVRRSVLDPTVAAALDEVSARLTTTTLRFLNWRVAHAGTSVAVEARGWLVRQGLIRR